jgi:hypothetical protein
MIVADQHHGFTTRCDWAEIGVIDWQDDPKLPVVACRVCGSKRTELWVPEGWSYEGSMFRGSTFVPSGEEKNHVVFLRHENGLDVYRDVRTGEEVFVGRPYSTRSQRPEENAGDVGKGSAQQQ